MKKIALFALLALFVSVAQAVTINWTATLKDGNGDTAGVSGMAILASHVDTTKHPLLWQILSWTSHNENTNYSANTGNGYVLLEQVKMNGSSVYANPTLDNGVFYHTTTFNMTDITDGKLALVFFNKYHEGATVLNVTLENLTADAVYDIDVGELVYQIKTGNSNPNVAVKSLTASAVPEPTALALLALGVAGLALRRRA
jgi:hypothetical protein